MTHLTNLHKQASLKNPFLVQIQEFKDKVAVFNESDEKSLSTLINIKEYTLEQKLKAIYSLMLALYQLFEMDTIIGFSLDNLIESKNGSFKLHPG
jgi:hypothetical protein